LEFFSFNTALSDRIKIIIRESSMNRKEFAGLGPLCEEIALFFEKNTEIVRFFSNFFINPLQNGDFFYRALTFLLMEHKL
jgi:hypothetical protein